MYNKLMEKIEDLIQASRSDMRYYTAKVLEEAADAIVEMSDRLVIAEEDKIKLFCQIPRWIPVTERLPKEMETVLVTDGKNVGWSFCVNDYGTMEFYSAWKITHWMPLPEPPMEEN